MAKKPSSEPKQVSLKQDEAQSRSVAEIQQEYTGLAMKSGQLQYQVFTLSKDLEILNKQMRDLNFEAAAVNAREAADAAKKEVANG